MKDNMKSKNCPDIASLAELVLGQLNPSKLRPMLKHLASCQKCRAQALAMRTVIVSRFQSPETTEAGSVSAEEDEEEIVFALTVRRII
jgi:anti-sigma factor RsiW